MSYHPIALPASELLRFLGPENAYQRNQVPYWIEQVAMSLGINTMAVHGQDHGTVALMFVCKFIATYGATIDQLHQAHSEIHHGT